jgi:hypothetical protein
MVKKMKNILFIKSSGFTEQHAAKAIEYVDKEAFFVQIEIPL